MAADGDRPDGGRLMRKGQGDGDAAGHYHRVKRIVMQALELRGTARAALIAREAGDDAELFAEVQALLAGMEADLTLRL